MTELEIAGETVQVGHTTGDDDYETLEVWRGPGRSQEDLLVAFTFRDRSRTPLLVHIPNEIELAFLNEALDHCLRWMERNLPNTTVMGHDPRRVL